MTQQQAQQRNHWIFRARGWLGQLKHVPNDVLKLTDISQQELNNLSKSLQEATTKASHTYVICNRCKLVTSGRRHQARNNYLVYICDVCGDTHQTLGHIKVARNKLPLHEATSLIRATYPELFL